MHIRNKIDLITYMSSRRSKEAGNKATSRHRKVFCLKLKGSKLSRGRDNGDVWKQMKNRLYKQNNKAENKRGPRL